MHAAEDVAPELVGAEQVMPRTGDCDGVNVCASGSCGAISGAKTAITIQASAIAAPMIASGWRHVGRDQRGGAPTRAGAAASAVT